MRSSSATPYDPGSIYSSQQELRAKGGHNSSVQQEEPDYISYDRRVPSPPKQVPSQKTFRIDAKVTFSSEFDSGNLTFVKESFPQL